MQFLFYNKNNSLFYALSKILDKTNSSRFDSRFIKNDKNNRSVQLQLKTQ